MTAKHLLVVAHTPSDNLKRLKDALTSGATGLSSINIRCVTPLDSGPADLADCAAVVLLTPENLGYMAGAMKDWFDRIYYPVLESHQGLPVVAIIRAGHDGTGTRRALDTITTGLRWRWVQEPLILRGNWRDEWCEEIQALGEAVATALDSGIF